VPESLFGHTVRCPECKAHFTAPIRDAEGELGTPVLLPQVQPQSIARPSIRKSPVYLPAMLLLMVGITGLLVNGFMAMQWALNPQAAEQSRYQLYKRASEVIGKEVSDDEARQGIEIMRIVEIVVACISLLPVLGALSMLTMRYRWLAILGSFVAMFNIANLCCLIGLPAGSYCLIKLLDPDIKPLFHRTPNQPAA
jgi:hypothetical protein